MGSSLVTKSRRKQEGLLYYLLYLKEQSFSPGVFGHVFWEGATRPPNPAVCQFILCPVCVLLLALNLQQQIGAA